MTQEFGSTSRRLARKDVGLGSFHGATSDCLIKVGGMNELI